MYIIYKHTLVLDCSHKGWSYIGQTVQKVNSRWRNGRGYRNSGIFRKAINKYGWENFSHEILADNIKTKIEANKLEQKFITKYHTYIKDPNCMGYNMTPGGDGGGFAGHKHSNKSKNKARQANKGKARSEEAKKHYKEAALRRPPMSAEIKLKISNTRKSLKIPSPTTTEILCIETQQIYPSIKAAVEATGFTAIPRCIQGKNLTAGGYHWAKTTDFQKIAQFSTFINGQQLPAGYNNCKAVVCIETGRIFLSIKEASAFIGCVGIDRVCRKERSTAGGYHWMYLNDLSKEELQEIIKKLEIRNEMVV